MATYPASPQAPAPQSAPSAAGAFNQQRQRLTQRFQAQGQEQDDAIKRKMAQLGNLNSGAAMKLQQQGQDQLTQQREEAIGNLDAQQAQQQIQLDESQRGRDFQRGMFDQTFGLQRDQFDVDKQTKLGQLDLAKKEMDMKKLEQEYNQLLSMRESGYGVDLTQALPNWVRDSTGRIINPRGYGLGYEEQRGVYSPNYQSIGDEYAQAEAIRRRIEDEQRRQAGAPTRQELADPNSKGWWNGNV